jgi:ABC-type bacteriocin/lantibiotic exporter with double-glycine peptidase domain
MTAGQLASFLLYSSNLTRAISKLSILYGDINKANGSASRIIQVI